MLDVAIINGYIIFIFIFVRFKSKIFNSLFLYFKSMKTTGRNRYIFSKDARETYYVIEAMPKENIALTINKTLLSVIPKFMCYSFATHIVFPLFYIILTFNIRLIKLHHGNIAILDSRIRSCQNTLITIILQLIHFLWTKPKNMSKYFPRCCTNR